MDHSKLQQDNDQGSCELEAKKRDEAELSWSGRRPRLVVKAPLLQEPSAPGGHDSTNNPLWQFPVNSK